MNAIHQQNPYEKNFNKKYFKIAPTDDNLFSNESENISPSLLFTLRMRGPSLGMSVTQRIKRIKQPYRGYLPRRNFDILFMNDSMIMNETENINAGLVAMAVEYLTRFMMGTPLENAFEISLHGARFLDLILRKENVEQIKSKKLLSKIKGLDSKSIVSACKLVGYDICFRAGVRGYVPVETIKPDKATINNIVTMVNRSLKFWSVYGPIIKSGFTFTGGYTDIVSYGDGDFLTEDTLWDFKVLKNEPTKDHTLQLLMYYILGCHSTHPEFSSIETLGIFNPRKNKIYLMDVDAIPPSVIDEVSEKVIGYT